MRFFFFLMIVNKIERQMMNAKVLLFHKQNYMRARDVAAFTKTIPHRRSKLIRSRFCNTEAM